MRRKYAARVKDFISILLLINSGVLTSLTSAQEGSRGQTPAREDEVLRVNTTLVQTDVTVVDQQGRFVQDLKRDQFELRVDGKRREIAFFEQARAGGANEEARLTAGGAVSAPPEATPRGAGHGRIIIFYLDDLHLAPGSAARARRALTKFIDEGMGADDQAAITSASGQVGFLQQLTGDRPVLRAAAARLNYRAASVLGDGARPLMNEHQAHLIDADADLGLLCYYMGLPPNSPGCDPLSPGALSVKERARRIIGQSDAVTSRTLDGLESLMRSVAALRGRKILFFFSDGFYINFNSSDTADRMRRITDAGARSGVVIYSVDARGLATDATFDASRESQVDPTALGALTRAGGSEVADSQEPLHTLAADTGGRALLKTNALGEDITRVLGETAAYYLLAWTPESAEAGGRKFHRIEIAIKDRPDLKVRVRRGYYNEAPADPKPRRNAPPPGGDTPENALRSALNSRVPLSSLPTALSLGYVVTPGEGMMLTASAQLSTEVLQFNQSGAKTTADVDMLTVVYNDRGEVVSSRNQRLSVSRPADGSARPAPFTLSQQFRLTAPGLYQVRIAARDSRSGIVGSVARWIETPDISRGAFALGSLLIGERRADAARAAGGPSAEPEVTISADHRFARTSYLRLVTYIYNASRSAAPPDVALQVRVLRGGQPILTKTTSKVSTEGVSDLARIPYAAEIQLDDLPAGRYLLLVTATDRASRSVATQRVDFEIL
ncbi:MAG TPA: VWA domain-containing protein [Pyrinomonadaceae bacterium]|jgi:VWFA-related protein